MKWFLKSIILVIIFLILIYLSNELLDDFNFTYKKEIKINEPLIKEIRNGEISSLSSSGILEWTNHEREKYGLKALSLNSTLNIIAEMKINDMIEKDYFDHVSPSGETIDDLANEIGYNYIGIGENLAVGGFRDDKDLVDGWMNSPGHRANILKSGYQEIGIFVKKGVYKNQNAWFAIQVFALPLSACPSPDYQLISEIDIKTNESEDIYSKIEKTKRELDSSRRFNREKIEEHNNLVLKYNNLLNEIKKLTETYNNQVNLMNNCMNSYGF